MITLPRPAADLASHQPTSSRWLPPMEGVDELWRAGPIALPGSGRVVWWTGRVAIGLRYEAPHTAAPALDRKPASWVAAWSIKRQAS